MSKGSSGRPTVAPPSKPLRAPLNSRALPNERATGLVDRMLSATFCSPKMLFSATPTGSLANIANMVFVAFMW
jgi:hypothetical protein